MNMHSSADSFMAYSGLPIDYNIDLPKGVAPEWDFVILSASNEVQAFGYRKQIEYRLAAGFLPNDTHYAVVPDIEGNRIGSGGAAFNILKYIRDNSDEADCFSNKRILVINSGGDSMRIPQYSACGKLFSPVPKELSTGLSSTLFDEIIKSVSEIPARMQSGLLTMAGDILIYFDPDQIDLKSCDAAAFSICEDIQKGRNHGVFIPDAEGIVKMFLHKSSIDDLRHFGAEDYNGKVHLDTGAIWFGSDIVKSLFGLISDDGKIENEKFAKFTNRKSRLSFYADFIYPMARDSSLARFYSEKPEGDFTDELICCRTKLWGELHKYSMRLISLSPAVFIHFGTTAELLKMMTKDIEKYSSQGWKRAVNSNVLALDRYSANSSFIDENTTIGDGSYIENSSLSKSKVGRDCIVSNVTIDFAEIPDNTVIHCLKQNDGGFVVRIYGIYDDPKQGIDSGGTFLGMPMRDFIRKHKIMFSDLWDNEPNTLWNAKLFCKCDSLRQSLEYALKLCTDSAEICDTGCLVSLKQSYENADYNNIFNPGKL